MVIEVLGFLVLFYDSSIPCFVSDYLLQITVSSVNSVFLMGAILISFNYRHRLDSSEHGDSVKGLSKSYWPAGVSVGNCLDC